MELVKDGGLARRVGQASASKGALDVACAGSLKLRWCGGVWSWGAWGVCEGRVVGALLAPSFLDFRIVCGCSLGSDFEIDFMAPLGRSGSLLGGFRDR